MKMKSGSVEASPASRARAVVRKDPDGATLAISGTLSLETAAAARREAQAALSTSRGSTLEVDASGVEVGDMSGMSVIYELAEGRLVPGVRATVKGLKPEFRILLSALPTPAAIESLEAPPPRRSLFGELGTGVISSAADLRQQLSFLGHDSGSRAALRHPTPALAGPGRCREGGRQRRTDRVSLISR
jgi:ABC-type transporter Mla MlaB component